MSENEKESSETAVANPEDVTSVYFNDYHDGVTGMELADQGRATIFKLDHKAGHYFPLDDEDEHHEALFVVIVNCRIYYRKFKNNQVICESDNGVQGYDTELNVERSCEPPVEGETGGCQYSYKINGYPGQGQCGLGMSIQGIAVLDDQAVPMQINMSGSSARAFSTFLKKLRRKQINMRTVLTRMGAKYIQTAENKWWAGEFKVSDDAPDPGILKEVNTIVEAQKASALAAEEAKATQLEAAAT